MRYLAWIDGRVVEASQLRQDMPYVMQRIHTLGGCVYNANNHLFVLREASEYLFSFASLITPSSVERIVAKLLDCAYAPLECSVPVVMRLYADGSLSFEVEAPTYGRGAYLRAKRYVGVEIEHSRPLPIMAQCSESCAADVMTERRVCHLGGDIALWTDAEGNLISLPWRPLFVYYKGVIFTPQEFHSVEYRMASKAIAAAGYELRVRAISSSALTMIDELFMVDVMGVSSLGAVRKHRLQSSVAIRVAKMMEPK